MLRASQAADVYVIQLQELGAIVRSQTIVYRIDTKYTKDVILNRAVIFVELLYVKIGCREESMLKKSIFRIASYVLIYAR